MLGPATIYLDRVTNKQEKFDAADRNSPKVIDSFTNISIKDTVFPYGHNREDREITRIETGGCNICFNSCTTKFHFKDDKLVKITGNEEDPALQGRVCPKSQISIQLYSSKTRLTQPLKRIGKRGDNNFEPISWDQALDEIAKKMRTIKKTNGSEALGLFSGTRTGTLTNRGYIRMFSKLWGTPNFVTT